MNPPDPDGTTVDSKDITQKVKVPIPTTKRIRTKIKPFTKQLKIEEDPDATTVDIEVIPPPITMPIAERIRNKIKPFTKPLEIEEDANYASQRNIAEGMMDIALLTANANQLRFLITYNSESKTYYISFALIILSLVVQIAVGITLIFKRQLINNRAKRKQLRQTNNIIIGGVFIVTVVNVLIASFTTTDTNNKD